MAATAWTVYPDEVTELIPADFYRDELVIQLHTGKFEEAATPVYLAFGAVPVVGTGLCLGNQGETVRILGAKARLAVNGISEGEISGGIETHTHLEYRHSLNWPPFITDPQYPVWPNKD